MNPILFLDFDGVLNSGTYMYKDNILTPSMVSDLDVSIDPVAVQRLNTIIAKTNCSVVISSSWRIAYKLKHIRHILNRYGFTGNIIGATPRFGWQPRGNEIQSWIDSQNVKPTSICILDDSSDMTHLSHYLVQTTWADGLQDVHVKLAIAMLEEHHDF